MANRLTTPAWITVGLGGYALIGGSVTLLGWALNLPRLTDWNASGISQMPNNALGVMAAGAALVLVSFGWRRAGGALGAFAGLIGAATLFEYLSGIDLGIDRLLLYQEWGQRGTVVPGRMGPPGSTSLTLIGTSIVLMQFIRTRRFAPVGGLLTAGIVMLSLVGYLFGADTLYTIPKLTTIALQTSTMLLALGIGLVVAVPEAQPLKILLEPSAAAPLVRRLWPATALLTVGLGWLGVRGQEAGLFDTAFGTALLVLSLLAVFTALLWWSATAIAVYERQDRESRNRLVSVLESIGDAVIVVDKDWRLLFVNEELRRRAGKDLDGLPRESIWDLFPDAPGNIAYEQLHRAMAERVSVEYEVLDEPAQRWFSDKAYPTIDGGLALFSRDVTEQKQNESELSRLAADLRDADRRKDEFLATLAHELRNPLAPMRNSLEIMKLAIGDAALLKQARSTMERQMGQMVRLIDDLLDVSRITRDKLDLRKERVELASIIHHAVEACGPLVGVANHELTVTVPPEPIHLHADPVRLAQVFCNLLTNACKYTEPGGRIRLTVERQGNDVMVSIKDNGIGIPSDMLPRVFEMFTQVDRTLERSQGGLGIGLTIGKRLVELHHGTVTAHSDGPGQGTEFVVRLPVFIEEPRPLPSEPAAGPHSTTPCRILVVDDNRDAATSLAGLLEMYGNKVQVAHDGVAAVEKAAATEPDVILLDIGMPRMNGYDACRAIREKPWGKDIVIVALTGWGQEEDRRKSREAGFDSHLVKPVELSALMKLLAAEPPGRCQVTPLPSAPSSTSRTDHPAALPASTAPPHSSSARASPGMGRRTSS